MKYIHMIYKTIGKVLRMVWNVFSLFFGFPYEEQAKKLGDWDARGEDNPKPRYTVLRANKVKKK